MIGTSLFKKILVAMLLISLLPLVVTSFILAINLGNIRQELTDRITREADLQASESLKLRAEQIAENVSGLLEQCEADLRLVAALPRTPSLLLEFYNSRRGEIWHRTGTADRPGEIREWIPLYASITLIDRAGHERVSIRNGRILPSGELRNVANPAETEFKSEEYFHKTRELKRGEVYVSHLTGFHIGMQEQLAGARDPEAAYGGREYRGVIRFATPLFDQQGAFSGIAVLSLDHRHLMEFTQHVLPGQNTQTVFPSYKSGNYAFIFDDQGWIITHPKYWDIRGVDPNGKLVPPYTKNSAPEDVAAGRIPYNLEHAGFIHPNYPKVAEIARRHQSGYVDITNVGGARKIMAFAPIIYGQGEYRKQGLFGAVTIGFQVDQFHASARAGAQLISNQLKRHVTISIILLGATGLLVVLGAWIISRGITRPLALLTEGTRKLASDDSGIRVELTSQDELGELASTFNRMADELEIRKQNLLNTLEELRISRREIIAERDFKESVLESISSAILTISPEGIVTSSNALGRQLLGEKAADGCHYREILTGWDDMAERVAAVLAQEKGYGREPLIVGDGPTKRYFEVGFFPIGLGATRGITVTMRNETEKEQLRQEMTRLDRLASLGRLSAGIAHEVRNPLTGISLLLDDLHDRPTLDQESRELMKKALAETERVERLVAALLNYASPTRADFREGDLVRTVHDTILLVNRECGRKGVTLSFAPEPLAPFHFDGEKIKQVLLNLVRNALEALPDGGCISIALNQEEGWVCLRISDSGKGIHQDDLPHIFEPFFTRKGTGTGLGLSIVQQIIEEHRGTIHVVSDEKGTLFSIRLPFR